VLEAIQIQEQHRDGFLVAARQCNRLIDPIIQQQGLGKPVRKSCSAEWVISSAIVRAVLTSRKIITAPTVRPSHPGFGKLRLWADLLLPATTSPSFFLPRYWRCPDCGTEKDTFRPYVALAAGLS
jgi:hypothetical protein